MSCIHSFKMFGIPSSRSCVYWNVLFCCNFSFQIFGSGKTHPAQDEIYNCTYSEIGWQLCLTVSSQILEPLFYVRFNILRKITVLNSARKLSNTAASQFRNKCNCKFHLALHLAAKQENLQANLRHTQPGEQQFETADFHARCSFPF